jgi:hypothetical protein
MSTDHRNTTPPRWAEHLLRLVLSPRDRESVTGDLLEEYREVAVPTLGRRARVWYVRQVAWYLFRAAWVPAALIGGVLAVRYMLDTLVPVTYTPGVIHIRSRVMSNALVAIFVLAAAHGAWRSDRVTGGVLVATMSGILGGLISIAATAVMLAIWHDPATMVAWQTSGGLDEALVFVPLLLVPVIGIVTGTAGAVVTAIVRWPFAPRA